MILEINVQSWQLSSRRINLNWIDNLLRLFKLVGSVSELYLLATFHQSLSLSVLNLPLHSAALLFANWVWQLRNFAASASFELKLICHFHSPIKWEFCVRFFSIFFFFFSFWFFVFIFRIPFIFFGFVFLANFLDQPASQQWTLPFDLVAQEDKSKYLLYKNRLDLLARNTIRDTSHGTGRVPGGISLLLAQIKNFNLSPFSPLSLTVLHSLFDVYKIHAVTWCLKAPTGSSICSSQQPCPRRCPRCLSALRAFNKLLTLYLIKVFFSCYIFFSLRCFLSVFFFLIFVSLRRRRRRLSA